MKPNEAIDALKKKFKCSTLTAVAREMGVSLQYLQQWQKGKVVSPNRLANLVQRAVSHGASHAATHSILPIAEYYPINRTRSSHDKKWHVLSGKIQREKALIDLLKTVKGVYVFYDSMYSPIYVGKTQKNNLWFEVNDAYNRKRSRQEVWRVNHPRTGKSFTPAHVKPRQIIRQQARLWEVATMVSAYQIHPAFIKRVEALLIRATANVGKNTKMETF